MKELIEKYLYIPVEGETINTNRECPPGFAYIHIYGGNRDANRQTTKTEHVALLDTGQLVYMDVRGAFSNPSYDISLGEGIYHHTVVRK